MSALEALCQRKSNGETLSMAEFAVWVLYSTARYSNTDAAKKTVEVAAQAAAELAGMQNRIRQLLDERTESEKE